MAAGRAEFRREQFDGRRAGLSCGLATIEREALVFFVLSEAALDDPPCRAAAGGVQGLGKAFLNPAGRAGFFKQNNAFVIIPGRNS
jgi:hypothetical protein